MTAHVSFDDVDGEMVVGNYDWYVTPRGTENATLVQEGNENTLDGNTHFDRGDRLFVVVTPNDGLEDGAVSGARFTEAADWLLVVDENQIALLDNKSPDEVRLHTLGAGL